MSIERTVLEFDIDPVPKGRPRFTRSGMAYTPAKSRAFETELSYMARAQYRGKPLEGALQVHIRCQMIKPKTVRREYPSVKPDGDNFLKAISDALNGVLWVDDAQIVDLSISKRYGPKGKITVSVIKIE